MALIISTNTNEWPQIDDQNLMASTNMGGDKPTQEQIQQQQNLALKCPRCDSANTKFCYYNNYSLSQPRHFCKACKRYWTRGGTLRNVPVGGGCRKNKRVKRPAAAASSTPVAVDLSNNNSAKSAPISAINSSNPLFYHGLQHNSLNPNSSELNLSFNSRVDHGGNNNSLFEYDLQPQISSLGFSSSGQIMGGDLLPKSLLSSYHHLPNFGSFSSSVSASPSMASLLSNIQQQKVLSNGVLGDTRSGGSHFLGFSQYEDHLQMQGSHDNGGMSIKEFNTEESQNRSSDNQIPQMVSSDPNSIIWNASGVGSWLDPAKSIGYNSVPSLI